MTRPEIIEKSRHSFEKSLLRDETKVNLWEERSMREGKEQFTIQSIREANVILWVCKATGRPRSHVFIVDVDAGKSSRIHSEV